MESPSDFDLLLDRYVDDKLPDAERLKFEAWMDVMKVHKKDKLDLSKEDYAEIYQRIISAMTSPEDIAKFTPTLMKAKKRKVIYMSVLKVAAVILLMVTASVVVYYSYSEPASTEVTVSTNDEKVILNDGTLVWLAQGSVLKYAESKDVVRSVSLTGTALFEVAKDATHPFTITTGDMTVTVLGTSFSISTDSKVLQLKVITGKVNLSSPADRKGIDVFPNESITYSPNGKVEIVQLQPVEVAAIVANTEYDMSFRNTLMSDVFSKIEKKFDVTISVADAKIKECRITADFSDHSLDDTMDLLTDLLDLEYVIKSKSVSVTGSGCN